MGARLFEPTDAALAAATLAQAAAEGMVVSPRGAGTKQMWSGDAAPDAYLSTRCLGAEVRHDAGDLVASIPAGVTIAEANRVLGLARQWLPLDPAHGDRATIGGIVATNDSGPRRHRFGSPRDLIIGIEIALADGRVAKSGGRVVKNVAGYDLSRLMCGSHGSLALVTSATFRLAPMAPASRTLVAHVPDARTAAELALEVHAAPVTPSAIEIEAPSACLLVRFETTERAAEGMAASVRGLLVARGATVDVLAGDSEAQAWHAHEAQIWGTPGIVVKLSVLPTEVAGVCTELERTAGGLDWSLTGRGALGVLLVRIDGDAEASVAAIRGLRALAELRGGSLAVLQAPDDRASRIRSVPSTGAAADLMRAVKARFDPSGVLGQLPQI